MSYGGGGTYSSGGGAAAGYSSGGAAGYSSGATAGGISYPTYGGAPAAAAYGSTGAAPAAGGGYSSAGYGAAGAGGASAGAAAGYGASASQSSQSMYAQWSAQASAYASGGSGGTGYSQPSMSASSGGQAAQVKSGGGGDLSSKLQAIASGQGGGSAWSKGASGGGGFSSGGDSGGRSGGLDMSKYAAYSTNKRKFDERGRGGDRDRRSGGFGDRDRDDKRPKREPRKPREGREPELSLFIDKKFNYWNLPVKAKVLLISNIPQDICHPDLLYNLFSFYGDVDRIKVLRRKTNCALVEFSSATFAAIARDHLDNTMVRGENMVATFSRFDKVRMPVEIGLPNDENTKDYTGADYNKFKRYWNEDMKKNNMRKIIKPTTTVHIGGLKTGQSPNEVRSLFESAGLTVYDCVGVAVKIKKKEGDAPTPAGGGRMFAYLQFGTVDDGVIGLAQYGNSAGMRISFAKDDLATLKKNCIEKKLSIIEGDQRGE